MKGLRKVGQKRVNSLLPSRSADSIRRLIESTQFKIYRANVMNVAKSEQTCGSQIVNHNVSLEEDRETEVSDDQVLKSRLSPERQMKVVDSDEIEFSEVLECQSNVSAKASTSPHHEDLTIDTPCRIQKQIPKFSEDVAADAHSTNNCSTIEVQGPFAECEKICDPYQNIETGFSGNDSVSPIPPAADLEFGFQSSSPPPVEVENNESSPYRTELVHDFEPNVDDPNLNYGGVQFENYSLGSEATENELNKTPAEEQTQPRSIVSRKFLENQKLASFSPFKLNLTPYRFATSRARAFLAKAGLGPLRADIASTLEAPNKEAVSKLLSVFRRDWLSDASFCAGKY